MWASELRGSTRDDSVSHAKRTDLAVATNPVTDATWAAAVLSSAGTVVVAFHAPQSSPCLVFLPVLEDLAEHLEERVTLLTLDVEQHPAAARRYDVTSLPTLLIFHGGALTGRMVGARSRELLCSELPALLE